MIETCGFPPMQRGIAERNTTLQAKRSYNRILLNATKWYNAKGVASDNICLSMWLF